MKTPTAAATIMTLGHLGIGQGGKLRHEASLRGPGVKLRRRSRRRGRRVLAVGRAPLAKAPPRPCKVRLIHRPAAAAALPRLRSYIYRQCQP